MGPTQYNYFKFKYSIQCDNPTQCLSIKSTSKQLEFNINTDYFEFETNATRTLRPKFDANGVEDLYL